jgi:hypothetical protein
LELLSDIKLFDNCSVTIDILLHKVVEKVTSVTNHLEKTATRVMVLVVVLEVLVEGVDSVGENRDLYLGRTGIGFVSAVFGDYCLLFVFE